MPEAPSPLYQLIETRLGTPLVDYIAANRPHKTWTALAADLSVRCKTSISGETLRLWFADRIQVEVTVR